MIYSLEYIRKRITSNASDIKCTVKQASARINGRKAHMQWQTKQRNWEAAHFRHTHTNTRSHVEKHKQCAGVKTRRKETYSQCISCILNNLTTSVSLQQASHVEHALNRTRIWCNSAHMLACGGYTIAFAQFIPKKETLPFSNAIN